MRPKFRVNVIAKGLDITNPKGYYIFPSTVEAVDALYHDLGYAEVDGALEALKKALYTVDVVVEADERKVAAR